MSRDSDMFRMIGYGEGERCGRCGEVLSTNLGKAAGLVVNFSVLPPQCSSCQYRAGIDPQPPLYCECGHDVEDHGQVKVGGEIAFLASMRCTKRGCKCHQFLTAPEESKVWT
jgi:hypothetical protein